MSPKVFTDTNITYHGESVTCVFSISYHHEDLTSINEDGKMVTVDHAVDNTVTTVTFSPGYVESVSSVFKRDDGRGYPVPIMSIPVKSLDREQLSVCAELSRKYVPESVWNVNVELDEDGSYPDYEEFFYGSALDASDPDVIADSLVFMRSCMPVAHRYTHLLSDIYYYGYRDIAQFPHNILTERSTKKFFRTLICPMSTEERHNISQLSGASLSVLADMASLVSHHRSILDIADHANLGKINNVNKYDLDHIRPPMIVRILREFLDSEYDDFYLDDVLSMSEKVPASVVRATGSIVETHDHLVKYITERKDIYEGVHDLPDWLIDIPRELDGMTFVPLRAEMEYFITGKQMDLCVGNGTYFDRASYGHSYVIRVDIDKEMRYLIQCSTQSRKVMQFYGPSNVEVDNQVKAHICALIGIEP